MSKYVYAPGVNGLVYVHQHPLTVSGTVRRADVPYVNEGLDQLGPSPVLSPDTRPSPSQTQFLQSSVI